MNLLHPIPICQHKLPLNRNVIQITVYKKKKKSVFINFLKLYYLPSPKKRHTKITKRSVHIKLKAEHQIFMTEQVFNTRLSQRVWLAHQHCSSCVQVRFKPIYTTLVTYLLVGTPMNVFVKQFITCYSRSQLTVTV